MRRALALALALALPVAAPSARAQETASTEAILAAMPKELAGGPVFKLPDGMLMYMVPGPGGDPIIVGVSVARSDEILQQTEIRRRVRNIVTGKPGFRQIVREGTFTTPKWPGAATFFVDYSTDKYLHQSWHLLSGKDAITIVTTYEKKKHAKRAEGLVADKILDGAVISAAKPAE